MQVGTNTFTEKLVANYNNNNFLMIIITITMIILTITKIIML